MHQNNAFCAGATALVAGLFVTTLIGPGVPASAQELPYLNPITLRLWQKHIPDFYQHQKWGNDANLLLNDETWQTILVFGKGPGGDPIQYPVPVGWSRHAATANVFYHWRQMGFNNMAPANSAGNPTWLNSANDLVQTLAANGSDVADELEFRMHSQRDALGQRLSYSVYEWQGGELHYRSANGTTRPIRVNGQPASIGLVAATEFAAGGTVNAILKKTGGGPFSTQLWWSNFHAVTLAGVDLDQRQLIVADPDSNKGNTDTDAGWSGAWPDLGVVSRKYTPWNGVADTVPVPPLGTPFPMSDPVDFDLRYMPLTLASDGRTIDGSVESNARYRNVQIAALEVIRPTSAGTSPLIVPTGGLFNHSYEIGNGFGQGAAFDELWLIPVATLDTATPGCVPFVEVFDPWLEIQAEVDVVLAGELDPHGNTLQHDAFRVQFDPPLHNEAFATLKFCTSTGYSHFGDGYDVLYRPAAFSDLLQTLPRSVRQQWTGAHDLFLVHTFGGEIEPYLPGDQQINVCIADFNGDGVVDGADLGLLLSAWGTSLDRDLSGDGIVDGVDLGILLALWGPCQTE